MIDIEPIKLKNGIAIGVSTNVPKAKLMVIKAERGFIMCGALDIKALDRIHPERHIIAANLIGVKSISDMLKGKINEATLEAQKIGIEAGTTTGEQALEKMM
jgi:uncharacterized protein YunC (DUF1805 family)